MSKIHKIGTKVRTNTNASDVMKTGVGVIIEYDLVDDAEAAKDIPFPYHVKFEDGTEDGPYAHDELNVIEE